MVRVERIYADNIVELEYNEVHDTIYLSITYMKEGRGVTVSAEVWIKELVDAMAELIGKQRLKEIVEEVIND